MRFLSKPHKALTLRCKRRLHVLRRLLLALRRTDQCGGSGLLAQVFAPEASHEAARYVVCSQKLRQSLTARRFGCR